MATCSRIGQSLCARRGESVPQARMAVPPLLPAKVSGGCDRNEADDRVQNAGKTAIEAQGMVDVADRMGMLRGGVSPEGAYRHERIQGRNPLDCPSQSSLAHEEIQGQKRIREQQRIQEQKGIRRRRM